MRMRQETFKKSYYIPAFGKSAIRLALGHRPKGYEW